MKDISRREVLLGAIAVTAAAALPTIPAPAAMAPEALPAWAVGTPGEFNFQHIVAKTAEEAEKIFRAEWCDDSCEGEEDAPCGACDACCLEVNATRVEIWDGKKDTTSGDWLEAGMGTYCARCSYECFADNGAKPVNGEAVCEECMTLADWDIIDPEHAAELRAEMS